MCCPRPDAAGHGCQRQTTSCSVESRDRWPRTTNAFHSSSALNKTEARGISYLLTVRPSVRVVVALKTYFIKIYLSTSFAIFC